MRINRQIRAPKVRLISKDGEQLGVYTVPDALKKAQEAELDLVEIAPNASPPVCKIIDYGKYRYSIAKKEKESKKAQHQIKVKEVKLKPNTDQHDFEVKARNARKFLEKGNKVKITLMFRGREMAHPEIGIKMVEKMCETLEDLGTRESEPKRMGRFITTVVSPGSKKK